MEKMARCSDGIIVGGGRIEIFANTLVCNYIIRVGLGIETSARAWRQHLIMVSSITG